MKFVGRHAYTAAISTTSRFCANGLYLRKRIVIHSNIFVFAYVNNNIRDEYSYFSNNSAAVIRWMSSGCTRTSQSDVFDISLRARRAEKPSLCCKEATEE